MEKLTEKDYKNMQNAIIAYKNLTPSEKKKVNDKIHVIWKELADKFALRCLENKDLEKMSEFIKDYEKVTSFDMKDNYQTFLYWDDDSEDGAGNEVYEYDRDEHERAIYIYNNPDFYKQQVREKIEELKNKRLVHKRKEKLNKLENELKDIDKIYEKYANLLKQQDLKDEYLRTRSETYEKYCKEFRNILEKYSEEILVAELKENPGFACIERDYSISSKYKIYDSTVMKNTFNKIRQKAINYVEKDVEKFFNVAPEK